MTTTTHMRSAPCRFGDGRDYGAEHAPTCARWLDAVAYLSAGLDDD